MRKPDNDHSVWEILPAGKMRAKYGLFAENAPRISLDPRKIPESLHALIPLAQHFGVSDDLIREDIVAKATPGDRDALVAAVEGHRQTLEAWLVGPEVDGPSFSDEYIAFSAMVMAADSV